MALVIHQTLHGYSDGHRLIASSLQLSGPDARIMVVMSDLSGPGVKPESSGYLTGYPLEGAGKYVLSRTWAAPEMPRPGCVWTHSLIIDNADLATMSSARDLLAAFRRPAGPSFKSEYSGPAIIDGAPSQPTRVPLDRARTIIAALYLAPEQPIVAEVEKGEEDEWLITAIWMQQWPRLRRAFGFCTLAGMDRSEKGVPLDLQLVGSLDRQIRSRFPDAVTPSEITAEPSLEPLTADLEGRDGTQVREFLRRTGGDVDGGRRAMLPLCRLYSSLFANDHPDLPAAVDALGHLDSLGARQARSIRTLIANRAIEDVDEVNDAVFAFVMETLEQDERASDQTLAADRVGAALWRRSPPRFMEAIETGGVVGRASSEALAKLAAEDLVKGLRDYPMLAPRVAGSRSDLLELMDFWNIPDVDENLASGVDSANAGRVAKALLAANRIGPAPLISRADPVELAAALNGASKKSVLDAWLNAISHDPGKAASVLGSGQITHRSIVVGLARACDPEMLPNESGEDPWLVAVRAAKKPEGQTDEEYLAAFLMARALGSRSRSSAELIRLSFSTLYRAFQQRSLPVDAERMVTWRLDWGGWFGWDESSRLKETVVRRFVDRKLDPEIFGRLTDDGSLAFSLIDEAARSGPGRRYLSDVGKRLKDSGDKGMKARAEYIASKIK